MRTVTIFLLTLFYVTPAVAPVAAPAHYTLSDVAIVIDTGPPCAECDHEEPCPQCKR